ncbi:type III pantothenate kinase [bacterium]|nr:type III pantothenate kinase [bacterium]
MVLLIDIGNTYTKISNINRDFFIQISTSSYQTVEEIINTNHDFFQSTENAIISSVVKGKADIFRKYLIKKYNIDPIIVSHDLIYNTIYPKKEENELGADLIAIMEALTPKFDSYIGVSLGTATVFVVVRNHKFIGCAIAPGVFTSLNGLVNSASLIENTKLRGEYTLLGMNTESSLRSGIWNGFTYLVDGYIENIKKECNMMDAPSYFVGGFSETIIKNLKSKNVIYDKDLVFKGLESIYNLNK